MIKTTVTGISDTIAQLQRELMQFAQDNHVTVGIHSDAGQHPDAGISNAELGAIHEFGADTVGIPARPWLSPGVNSGNEEYLKIIENTIANGEPIKQGLERVGLVAVGKVQKYMTELRTPANAPSTIKRKGSSNPLIDTGALRASVTYKVTSTKPTEGL